MKNNYSILIKQTVPLLLVLIFSISLQALSQQNEKTVLTTETIVTTKAVQTTKVFSQPFTFEKELLTGGENILNHKSPFFIQTFATEKKQLSDDQLNLKSAIKAVSSISAISGIKEKLSVSGKGTTHLNATLASEGPIGTPDHYAVPTDKILTIAAPGFPGKRH
jgi:hypothetical protein